MNDNSLLSVGAYTYDSGFSDRLESDTQKNATPEQSVQDHFQGALLGFALAPTAVSLLPGVMDATIENMIEVVQVGLTANGQATTWLPQLSTLLRDYDGQPHSRHNQCLLSDAISRVLRGLPLTTDWLQGRQRTTDGQAIPDSHPVAVGIASVVNYTPAHYSICVPIAARSNGAPSSETSGVTSGAMANWEAGAQPNWEAALVAGLVCGAIGGRSALPALWQVPSVASSPIASSLAIISLANTLADTLFYQWAGAITQQPIDRVL